MESLCADARAAPRNGGGEDKDAGNGEDENEDEDEDEDAASARERTPPAAMLRALADWPQCTPRALYAMTCDGRHVPVVQLLFGTVEHQQDSWASLRGAQVNDGVSLGNRSEGQQRAVPVGVPAAPIPMLPFDKYHRNPEVFATAVPAVQLRDGHPSLRFSESLDYILRHKADVVTMQSPRTAHIPILHFHEEQIARAQAVGAPFLVASGPSPYGPFRVPPTTMRSLYPHPQVNWDQGCEWHRCMRSEITSVDKGYKMRYNRLPGGRAGVAWGPDATYPEYRRVQFVNVDGMAVVRKPRLPDAFTEVKLLRMYTEAVHRGVTDMAIASSMALYGLQSGCSATATSHLWPNYSGAWPELDHLQAERVKKLTTFAVPRLLPTRQEPEGQPTRNHPKSVHVTPKKRRGITDPAAERRTMVQVLKDVWQSFTLKELRANLARPAPGLAAWDDPRAGHTRAKGPPGLDSINNCMDESLFAEFEYGSLRKFGEQLDILQSSGLAVDHLLEDFEAQYEQFPLDWLEHWYASQLVSTHGSNTDPRGCFGYMHLPDRLNRFNYMTSELVAADLDEEQQTICWTPWSTVTRARALRFGVERRAMGASGRYYCQMAWFDDNSLGCLFFFTQTAKRVQRALWTRLNIAYSEKKAAINLHAAIEFEAALGQELRCRERRIVLPASKVSVYVEGIDEMRADDKAHPKRLVERQKMDRSVGRILFACGPVPTIWTDFLILVGLLVIQRSFLSFVRFNDPLDRCLLRIRHKLQRENGRPTTSYQFRPGCDGLPVWVCKTDASRRVSTFFGAAGGWFYAWETNTVFFFGYLWPPEFVFECNIGELEMKAAEIAGRLVADVNEALYGCRGQRHYLYSYGDNEAVSGSVLNGMHARKNGMRFLTSQRASQELELERLLASAHIARAANKPADALANMDIPAFVRLVRREFPTASLCRLAVPDAYADLQPLIDWKRFCSV